MVGRDSVDRAHHGWLGQQRFELTGLQAAYDTTLETVLLAQSRRDRLDKTIVEMAHQAQWWPLVSRLQCLRGVSTLTAFGLAVEVGTGPGSAARRSGRSWGLCRPSPPAARAAVRARSPARARGHAGNQRLHDRWLRFEMRKKRIVIANVAVARELAGWCWSLALLEDAGFSTKKRGAEAGLPVAHALRAR